MRLPFEGGAIARVAQTGRTARIDLDAEPAAVRERMLAAKVSSGVAAPIVVSGRLWGATSLSNGGGSAFPAGIEERLEKFTSLVAVALANAEAREELTASRARIVQAGDAERRRLERNLHDGAQQRLVTLALHLRIAESRLAEDTAAAAELIAEACDELALALEELRELARGIHPAILTDHGLTPAVEALSARAPLPVEVNGLPSARLAEPIEAAAFYVVSESLTNVAKYASASLARVDLARDDGVLVVEVSDDGIGGADADKGSGLRGLCDRVEALGGRFRVSSEQGRGTTVRAELPLRVGASSARAAASRPGGAEAAGRARRGHRRRRTGRRRRARRGAATASQASTSLIPSRRLPPTGTASISSVVRVTLTVEVRGFGARAPQRLAEAGQLQSGRVQPGLEHDAVLVREGRALQLRQDLRDPALGLLDLGLEAVRLLLQILDPVALADDRPELRQLGERVLDLRRRDAQRDLGGAHARRRRVVLERGDGAAVVVRDLLCLLGRVRERVDVVDAEAELRLEALELAGRRCDRRAGRRVLRGGCRGARRRRRRGLGRSRRSGEGLQLGGRAGGCRPVAVAREPDHARRDQRHDDRRRHGERRAAASPT